MEATKEQRELMWHILIQWLSSRGELEDWMDDVLYNTWNQTSEIDPNSDVLLRDLNPFNWVATCGRGYKRWMEDWGEFLKQLHWCKYEV